MSEQTDTGTWFGSNGQAPAAEPGRMIFNTDSGKTIPEEWAPLIIQWLHKNAPVTFGRAILAIIEVEAAAAKRGPKPQE